MAILSKECKADNFESHSSLKLSFTRPSFQFCWMWIFPWTKLSWYSCPEWDELGWFSWFWQFLFEGLSSFNLKRCFTCMHGLVVYMKEGLTFALTKSLENSAGAFLMFWLNLLQSMSYFFFLYQSPLLWLWMVFDSISSNIDEILLINSSANVFNPS